MTDTLPRSDAPSVVAAGGADDEGWPIAWRGRWAWDREPTALGLGVTDGTPQERDVFVLFRRCIDVASAPPRARFRVVADGHFIVWLNGEEIVRGPIRAGLQHLYWEEADIAARLRPGRNVIACLVRHYGTAVPWWAPTPAYGSLGHGGFAMDSGDLPELCSDTAWRVRRGPWSPPPVSLGPPGEIVDARELPDGWTAPEFDDSAWDAAVVLGGINWPTDAGSAPPEPPFTVVAPSPLPQFTHETRAAHGVSLPRDVEPGAPLMVDLGAMTIGMPRVRLTASAGTSVVLRAGEHVVDGAIPTEHNAWAYRQTCREGSQLLQPFDGIGYRHLSIDADAPVTVEQVDHVERRYPFTVDGAFESDDAALNDIWRIGVRSLHLCSTDSFLDCPGREQRGWVGDAYIHSLLSAVTSDDPRLRRRFLEVAAESRRPDGILAMAAGGDFSVTSLTIPDYSLHWVRNLCRFWEHRADADLVDRLLPIADGILEWYWSFVRDGLLEPVPGWTFVDWWPIRSRVRLASLQGLLLLAFEDHATLADAAGHARIAARSRKRADELRRGFAYFAHPRWGVTESPELGLSSQHAVALAVLCGVINGDEAGDRLAAVMHPDAERHPILIESIITWGYPEGFDRDRHVIACQPFFSHWLHQAMALAGRHDLLLDSIRRWSQFVDAGDGTCWEFWAAQGLHGSHCHAWSATPTYDLSAHILGVRPASPGYDTIRVAPVLGSLQQLSGRVPTRHGPVDVQLRRSETGVTGSITLPAGTSGDAVLGNGAAGGRTVALTAGINRV